VRFDAPFDGIVTRRNIEEGENVVVGTMNNAGTVLLTVADMSVIEAEVEVDETDIPSCSSDRSRRSRSTRLRPRVLRQGH
jgi:multidrug resistance efflux pump